MNYLELVQSLVRTSLAYLCASLWGVRAIAGLVLGDGVQIWSSSLKTILELFVPLLFYCTSDVY